MYLTYVRIYIILRKGVSDLIGYFLVLIAQHKYSYKIDQRKVQNLAAHKISQVLYFPYIYF